MGVLIYTSMKTETETSIVMINKAERFSTIDGVIKPTVTLLSQVNKNLKLGLAKKVSESDHTLIYKIPK